ncbi:MAG: autotransporter-associated beta strand repeat-containing protein [Verrucomicrobia bacterium]|nr:autotransporter-associated beta strand repeat-containing protein [Verrucomicrobiota bacterium]
MKTKPCFPLLIAAIATLGLGPNAHALLCYWNTSGGGDWGAAANWLNGSGPGGAGDSAVFNNTGLNSNEIIYLTGNRSINAEAIVNNTGTTTIRGGTSTTPANNTLTVNNITVNAGAGAVTFGSSGALANIACQAGTSTGIVNNSSNLLTFNGTITAGTTTRPLIFNGSGDFLAAGVISAGRDNYKIGSGTVTFTAANAYTHATHTGTWSANGGTLKLVDAGAWSTPTSAATAMSVTLRRAGTFLMDNSGTTNATNRLPDSTLITSGLGGGKFSFQGANDAASTETVGVLTPASGVLTVDSVPGADTVAAGTPSNTLTFDSLARTPGATLAFSGAGLGGDGTNKIIFGTTVPTLTNHLIGGYATLGNEFATYNEDGAGTANTNGVQAVAAAGYTTTFGTNNNVKLTTAGALDTAANSLNLQTAAGQAFTIAGTLTTGAILNSNSGTGNNGISGGPLGNGTGELIITANHNLDISSSLIGNGVLTKSGAGTLTLGGSAATRTSANVFINQGILKITSPTLEVATNTTWTTSGKMPALTLNDNGATLKASGNSIFAYDKSIIITSLANGDATSVNLTASAGGDTIRLYSAVKNAIGSTAAPVIHVNGLGTVIIESNASNGTSAGSALNGSYAWNIDGGGKLLVTSTGASPLGLAGNVVTVTSGTLGLGNDATTNYTYIMNGGILCGAGGGTRTINTASTIQLAANSTIDLKDAAVGATANMNLGFNGVIGGSGTLTVAASGTGVGILTLGGPNSYTGNTIIANGTLALTGSGSITASPVVTINFGATLDVSAVGGGWSMAATQMLKGNGTVTGGIVAGTGTVSPGASTGSLAVSADANLTGSTLAIEIDDAQTPKCDTLVVAGALKITGATLNLNVTGTPTQATYIIATYGSLTGNPFTTVTGTGLPSGYEIDYTYNSNTAIAIKKITGGNTYANWLSTRSPATGFVTDSDNDGIPNGVENILGTNPNISSPGLIQVSATATSVTFQHTLNPTVASDVTRSYQWSTDLVEWKTSDQSNSGGTTAIISPSAPDAGVVTVTVTISKGSSNKLFGRLVATQP